MYVCIYLYIYISMYQCIYVSMYLCIYVSMHLCIYVCIYDVSMYGCMYTHVLMGENFVYTYIYIYVLLWIKYYSELYGIFFNMFVCVNIRNIKYSIHNLQYIEYRIQCTLCNLQNPTIYIYMCIHRTFDCIVKILRILNVIYLVYIHIIKFLMYHIISRTWYAGCFGKGIWGVWNRMPFASELPPQLHITCTDHAFAAV